MGPEFMGVSGIWFLFPIIGFAIMMTFMYLMFGRRGHGSPWQESGGRQSESRDSETALDIPARRYARGEITQEEFEQMKESLSNV